MELSYAIDTSAFSEFGRGNPRLRGFLDSKHDLYMPLIVLGELRAGFANGAHPRHNESLFSRFLAQPHVSVLVPTEETTHRYAHIFAALRAKGRAVNVNDMWIAALAIEHRLPLLTMDSDFAAIDGLELVGV